MQPLFTHNRLLLGVWLASLLLWRVLEVSVDIRTFKRLRAGIQRQDKRSYVALLVLVVFGVLLGLLLAFMGCALLGVSYRIHVEEHVLKAQLGQRYQEYMRRTKRLIPFVL